MHKTRNSFQACLVSGAIIRVTAAVSLLGIQDFLLIFGILGFLALLTYPIYLVLASVLRQGLM